MDRWEWTGARPTTQAEVDDVRALRPRLREIWGRDEDGLVEAANTLLEEGRALPRLVRHGAFGWHVHATSDDAPLARRIAVEVGMALVDVIRAGETDRLKVCAGEDCEDLVIDLSKNRSRKFCDGTCGTRANVAAYRARKACHRLTATAGIAAVVSRSQEHFAKSGSDTPLIRRSAPDSAVEHDAGRMPGAAPARTLPGGTHIDRIGHSRYAMPGSAMYPQ